MLSIRVPSMYHLTGWHIAHDPRPFKAWPYLFASSSAHVRRSSKSEGGCAEHDRGGGAAGGAGSRETYRYRVAVIGAGPAGLMAAEVLAAGGAAVTVYDRMPSAGRKILLAGRGGPNPTHRADT